MTNLEIFAVVYAITTFLCFIAAIKVLKIERDKHGYLTIENFLLAIGLVFTPVINTIFMCLMLIVMACLYIDDTQIWNKFINYKFFKKVTNE